MARIEVQRIGQTPTTSTLTTGFLPVQSVAQRRTARRTASRSLSSLALALRRRRGRGRAGLLEEGLAVLLDRHALKVDLDVALEAAVAVERERDRDQAGKASRRRSFMVAPSAGRMTSPSRTRRPTLSSRELLGPVRREPDEVAILLDDAVGDAAGAGEAGLLRSCGASRHGRGR